MSLFEFLSYLPFASISSFIATILVVLFFVTSADSGALVTDYLTAKSENSPIWQRLFWTVLMAVLSIILLVVGGLGALQSATMMSALPFTLIMLLLCWGLLKALHLDVTKMNALQVARITPRAVQNPRSWQQRLGLIMHYPHTQNEVNDYVQQHVQRAFESIQREFKRRHLVVNIYAVDDGLALSVDHQSELNFVYKVLTHQTEAASFMLDEQHQDIDAFYQAEVVLREGGQGYDVMDWTQEDLLQDIIDQYERHLHFLNVIRN